MTRLPLDCIFLAAGMSVRMGTPKLLIPLEGKPLFLHGLETALSVCRRVILVTGAADLSPHIPGDAENLSVVKNPDFQMGQLGSLQKGLESAATLPVFVTLGDLPDIQAETFRRLAGEMNALPAVFPVCHGKQGHPVLLGEAAVRMILQADRGEKAMKVILPLGPRAVPVNDPGIFRDVDTPEDLQSRGL